MFNCEFSEKEKMLREALVKIDSLIHKPEIEDGDTANTYADKLKKRYIEIIQECYIRMEEYEDTEDSKVN